jgi:serine/threonine-protein kinase HipA
MRFLDASDDREVDRATFLRAQLAFFLLGAVDGHAKNFSVFLTPSGFRLTPMYDILSIEPALRARQLGPRDARLAMCVGKSRHYRLCELRRRHWEETAKAAGFPSADLATLIDDILERVRRLDALRARISEPVPRRLAETVIRGVVLRARALEGGALRKGR